MFSIKRLWTPLALSQHMISPLEIIMILMIGFMAYSSPLPIPPTEGGWSELVEWFACGSALGSIGLILIARGVYVGVGIAATAATVGGATIALAGAAMIGIAVIYAIAEIT